MPARTPFWRFPAPEYSGRLARGILCAAVTLASAHRLNAAIEFSAGAQLPLSDGSANTLALGDLDGDGDLDLVVAVNGGFSRIWINQGLAQGGSFGDFAEQPQEFGTGTSRAVAVGDLDGDEDLDLFFLEDPRSGAYFQIWMNQGGTQGGTEGAFLQNAQADGDFGGANLALGDLNGDALTDAFVVRSSFPDKVWTNSPSGLFLDSGQELGAREGGGAGALGDTDGDGDLDAWVGDVFGNTLWINQGGIQGGAPGFFEESGQDLDGDPFSSTGIAFGDLDADGDLDAFLGKGTVGEVWVNQGGSQGGTPGTFLRSPQDLGPNDNSISQKVALGDLDLDGDLDAFVARFGLNLVLENDGLGNFTRTDPALGGLSNRSLGIALGDLDNDGKLDAVTVGSSAAQIWLNESPRPGPTFPEYTISTYAGTGVEGSTGDGGPAIQAQISANDLAVDSAGNLYLAENKFHRIRKVALDGTISNFAGTGTAGFSGDGGPAALAQLNSPSGIAVDAADNLYILDHGNACVRKVDPSGIISTITAQNLLTLGNSRIALDAPGNIYFTRSNHVYRIDTAAVLTRVAGTVDGFSGDGGPATAASLDSISGLATANGELLIADSGNHRIRKVDAAGIITTIAGSPSSGYAGNGGPAIAARLFRPEHALMDSAGAILISDRRNYRIRRIDTNGIIATIAGNGASEFGGEGGPARDSPISEPGALAIDHQGNIFFLEGPDTNACKVRKLSPTGNLLPLAPSYFSIPPPGLIDFGTIVAGDTFWRSFPLELAIGNGGTADLQIQSIEWINPHTALTFTITKPSGSPHTSALPHTITDGRDGLGSDHHSISVQIEAFSESPLLAGAILRVQTNDPESPVIEYLVRAGFAEDDSGTAEQVVAWLLLPRPRSGSSQGAQSLQKSALQPEDGIQTVTLLMDTNATRQLTTEIPDFLGGGSVVISNFTGTVVITAIPLPNDAGRMALSVESGMFTAPSFALPSGLQTGPNTLTFGPPEQSGGMLLLTNSQYTAYATATIRNTLFPEGITVRGTYTGTFDPVTGSISVTSNSTDFFEKNSQIQWSRSLDQVVLRWSLDALLEAATNIIGPWKPLTNAASPYAIPLGPFSQEFFRLQQSPP